MSKDEKNKGTMLKDTMVLFIITLVAALLLGLVYEITKEPIARAQAAAKTKAYQIVFSGMSSTAEDEVLEELVEGSEDMLAAYPELVGSYVKEAMVALDENNNPIGYVMTVVNTKGYGGKIEMAMGVSADGTMTGLEFLTITETAGLGMKAKDEKFKSQFFGVRAQQFSLSKAKIPGDVEVDAISSATVTTSAVTRGINAGLRFASSLLENKVGGVGQ